MRNSRPSGHKGANLRGAVLEREPIQGTRLAPADLTGAILTDAIYDQQTRWPQGFDPQRHGAVPAR